MAAVALLPIAFRGISVQLFVQRPVQLSLQLSSLLSNDLLQLATTLEPCFPAQCPPPPRPTPFALLDVSLRSKQVLTGPTSSKHVPTSLVLHLPVVLLELDPQQSSIRQRCRLTFCFYWFWQVSTGSEGSTGGQFADAQHREPDSSLSWQPNPARRPRLQVSHDWACFDGKFCT